MSVSATIRHVNQVNEGHGTLPCGFRGVLMRQVHVGLCDDNIGTDPEIKS